LLDCDWEKGISHAEKVGTQIINKERGGHEGGGEDHALDDVSKKNFRGVANEVLKNDVGHQGPARDVTEAVGRAQKRRN